MTTKMTHQLFCQAFKPSKVLILCLGTVLFVHHTALANTMSSDKAFISQMALGDDTLIDNKTNNHVLSSNAFKDNTTNQSHSTFEDGAHSGTEPSLPTSVDATNFAPSASTTAHTPYDDWAERKRSQTKAFLNKTAKRIDKWFGNAKDTDKETAYASLRIMTDFHYDEYNGETIKPKIRGRIRLPALENRLSIMIGADDLDDKESVGSYNQSEAIGETLFNREESRDENASLALRFSKDKVAKAIDTDFDIGTRSGNELYLRLRAEKQNTTRLFGYDDVSYRFEQIYRYGTKSKHYLRTNYDLTRDLSDKRTINGLLYIDYSKNDVEEVILGHTLRQTHHSNSALGQRTLSYGLHLENRLDEMTWANRYGPFIHYRQPILRPWFFVQTEASFYNNKLLNEDHHFSSFLRLEAVF